MTKLIGKQLKRAITLSTQVYKLSVAMEAVLEDGYDDSTLMTNLTNRDMVEALCENVTQSINLIEAVGDLYNGNSMDSEPQTKVLFTLTDGTDIYHGDKLWHPDPAINTGYPLIAEFKSNEADCGWVTLRHKNGAVPRARIADLKVWKNNTGETVLFTLKDGTKVREGDSLWHPVWCNVCDNQELVADTPPNLNGKVNMRMQNGHSHYVPVSELQSYKKNEILFTLSDGTDVRMGDTLWHPHCSTCADEPLTVKALPNNDNEVLLAGVTGILHSVVVDELRVGPPPQVLFALADGVLIHKGDSVYHPDHENDDGKVVEFIANETPIASGDKLVDINGVVKDPTQYVRLVYKRQPNSSVILKIADLQWWHE